jgi:hypothetical protein
MFLGENLIVYLVLALGGALAVGNILAMVKPPEKPQGENDLQVAPKARSLGMAFIGIIAALWSIVSLIKG